MSRRAARPLPGTAAVAETVSVGGLSGGGWLPSWLPAPYRDPPLRRAGWWAVLDRIRQTRRLPSTACQAAYSMAALAASLAAASAGSAALDWPVRMGVVNRNTVRLMAAVMVGWLTGAVGGLA